MDDFSKPNAMAISVLVTAEHERVTKPQEDGDLSRRSFRIPYQAYKRYLAQVIRSKQAWRRQQARLPIEEKLRIVEELRRFHEEIPKLKQKNRG